MIAIKNKKGMDLWISPKAGNLTPRGAVGGLLVLLSLLAAGCHTAKKVPTVPEAPTVEEVAPAVRTYTVLTFEAEVEGIAVNGQLRVAEDSAMWVSVTKVIEMGRAMCTPDSLWLRAPLLGRDEAMDYAALRRQTGVDITFAELQQTVLAPDAEERLARMAQRLGVNAAVRITRRMHPEHLTFPYNKPVMP